LEVCLETENLEEIIIPVQEISSITPGIKPSSNWREIWMENTQSTRYLFSPSGYGLDDGAGYYQLTMLLSNQLGYGITDYFSIGAGIMPIYFLYGIAPPVWITPKVSIPVFKEKLSLGGGAIFGAALGFGTVVLPFAVSTIGNRHTNLTVGFGYPFINAEWYKPVYNLSGMLRLKKSAYLITENYFTNFQGNNYIALSLGGRFVAAKISLDYGLMLVTVTSHFYVIPRFGVTFPMGRK
jgi:hypothetical protein